MGSSYVVGERGLYRIQPTMLPHRVKKSGLLFHSRNFETFWMNLLFLHDTLWPLPSKISGNVEIFSFYKNMYFTLSHVEGSAQRKLPDPKRCLFPEFDDFGRERLSSWAYSNLSKGNESRSTNYKCVSFEMITAD